MPRIGLDAAAVVTAGAELADRDGLDGLTLARLAAELQVKPPSLYAHIGGLDDLRTRIASVAAAEMGDALATAAAGRARGEALRSVGRAYREWALAHPGRYAALQFRQIRDDPAAVRVVGIVLAVLEGYGLSGDDGIHAARTVRSALHGFISLEAGDGFGIPLGIEDSFERLLDVLDRGLESGTA